MDSPAASSFRFQMGALLFLAGIFYLNSLSRVILAPLMPTVEGDLKIGHGEAGSLFLMISLGYCLGLLASGFISSRLHHRRTILLSSIAVGGTFMVVSFIHDLWMIRCGLLGLGIATGLYLPSGIATITGSVHPQHWGKAFAVHELAPNLSFVTAPLLSELFLGWISWRGVLMLIGMMSIVVGFLFAFFGKGGDFPGEAPNPQTLRNILAEPSFWIMMVLFGLGVGSGFGTYSMLPLYLVSEKGIDRLWANTLLGMSRILASFMTILGGWITDRLGVKQTLKAVFLCSGFITGMLGMVSGQWIVIIVLLQPMVAACFFSAGFVALSRMGSPRTKNVTVALTVPIGHLIGAGVIPAGIGFLGEGGFFPLGFIILGGVLLGGVILVRYLRFPDE